MTETPQGTGQTVVHALARRGKATWASFRQLSVPWQGTVAVLLLLLFVAAGDGSNPPTETQQTSAVAATAETDDDADAADKAAIEELTAEISTLREQVAMAEAEADRAEAAQEDAAATSERVRSQRNRISNLTAQNTKLENRLEASRAKVAKAKQKTDNLRAELASLSAAAAAPAPDADVAAEEPADDGCHPSYTGCVPIASDVDCAGGSGNGPEYTGYVEVIGPDEYDLDSDGDGDACE